MSQGQLWDAGPVAIKAKRGRPQICFCNKPGCRVCYARRYARELAAGLRTIRRGGGRVEWRPEEDALLGTGHDRIVAIVLGRTMASTANRRLELGIPAHRRPRRRRPEGKPRLLADGYVAVRLASDDPLIGMARKGGMVQQHRLVMARHLGRALAPTEIVHHRNGIRHDNRIENLELWTRPHPPGQRVADHATVR